MTNHLTLPLREFAAQLRAFMRDWSRQAATQSHSRADAEFNRLALALYALQFEGNAAYRRFCESRKAAPEAVQHWADIPAVPAAAFKELELTSLPPAHRTAVFHSSGTTGQIPSRHFHCAESLALYEASLLSWFAAHFAKAECVFLTPPPAEAPHSSLAYMFETIRREFASPGSVFTGESLREDGWDVDLQRTQFILRKAIAMNRPVNVLGTAFNFVHLLDYLKLTKARLELPRGSRVLETGGYKGRSRALPKSELHGLITEWLGIAAARIICEYGMSELSSQAYDSAVEDSPEAGRIFYFPPWARAQIISPETGREVGEAETGLLRIFDLANVWSVMAIQTEDLGVRRGGGFELLGRAVLAETRGCSLASV